MFVDQDVCLVGGYVRQQDMNQRPKSYPLEIPMYHFLVVHIYQSPSDIFELVPGGLSAVIAVNSRGKTVQARIGSRPCAP